VHYVLRAHIKIMNVNYSRVQLTEINNMNNQLDATIKVY